MLIVHLSDIHFKDNDDDISFLSLYESIKHKINESDKFIFLVSGDIAYSGSENEYVKFDKELQKLINIVKEQHSGKELLTYLIPGNHDCNFQQNSDIRRIVVENVKKNGYKADSDNSIFSLCTKIQDDFFTYLSTIDRDGIKQDSHRLCWQKEINLDNYSVLFTFYNTAWLSSKKEDPGSLYYPTEILSNLKQEDNPNLFKVGVYHHPDNWISPKHDEQNHREFRNHVTRYNNIIFTGHEHQEHLEKYNDLSNGHDCYIHESSAFHDGPTYGGFSTIELQNDGSLTIEEFKYDYKSECFIFLNESSKFLQNGSPLNHNYELRDKFKDFLSDTEVYVSSSTSTKLSLKDIFTFPKLENIETERVSDSEEILKSKDIGAVVLFGTDQSGKTSILKMVFSYWYYHGLTPLFVDAYEDIRNNNINQMLKNVYKKQYNDYKTNFDKYLSLGYDKKIILVDNFHLLRSKLDRDEIVQKLKGFTKKIILIFDDVSALEETSLGSENVLFDKYSILPFGHLNRDSIIEKWLSTQELSNEQRFQKKRIIHNKVDDILGNNLVPSYPLFILTILQALDFTSQGETEITSYGHCYQTLIYLSFKKNGLKDDEFIVIDNFLSHLAYKMYEQQIDYLSFNDIEVIFTDYSKNYITTKDLNELLTVLLNSKTIIQDSMDDFGFKYIYIYYYYVAKYLSKYKIEESGFIEKLCSELEKKENSFIILFITYHSDNQGIIEEIIYNTMGQFVDTTPITLVNSETDFMINSVETASSTVLENIKPEEYHKKELISKDHANKTKNDIENISDSILKINKALKSIEINGQLLKVRYGSINIPRLKNIIEESFLVSFRLINFLISDLSNEETAFLLAEQFEEYIRINSSKIPSKPSREELIIAIQKILSNLTYYVCHFTLDKTAFFLGNEKLLDLYREIADEINTPASKLTLMLIEFKLIKKIDKRKIKELKEAFKDNSFAFSILQKAAVNYIYMHHLDHDVKSWIASTLNIPIINQRKIENKKNK